MLLNVTGLKSALDIDKQLLICTAKNIEEMSVKPTANQKQVMQKSMSLLNYLNVHTQLLDKDSELKLALENCCWVVPEANPPPSKKFALGFWFFLPFVM